MSALGTSRHSRRCTISVAFGAKRTLFGTGPGRLGRK
jgi:hypothetical protein